MVKRKSPCKDPRKHRVKGGCVLYAKYRKRSNRKRSNCGASYKLRVKSARVDGKRLRTSLKYMRSGRVKANKDVRAAKSVVDELESGERKLHQKIEQRQASIKKMVAACAKRSAARSTRPMKPGPRKSVAGKTTWIARRLGLEQSPTRKSPVQKKKATEAKSAAKKASKAATAASKAATKAAGAAKKAATAKRSARNNPSKAAKKKAAGAKKAATKATKAAAKKASKATKAVTRSAKANKTAARVGSPPPQAVKNKTKAAAKKVAAAKVVVLRRSTRIAAQRR